VRSRHPVSRLLRPTAAAFVLVLAPDGSGSGDEPAPPRSGEEQGTAAAESCALQLEDCRADLAVRRAALIEFDRDFDELKAERTAAHAALEQCRKQAVEARAEADRLRCIYVEGRRPNPVTLRCEGPVRYRIHLEPKR